MREEMKCRLTAFIIITGICLLVLCGKKAKESELDVLARVGDRIITVQDFVKRVEMSPLPSDIDMTQFEGREHALKLLVDEKLLALAAENDTSFHDPLIPKKMRSIEETAVNRELYMEEVRNRVHIDEVMMRDAFGMMHERRIVSYLHTRDRREVEGWAKAMEEGLSFDSLYMNVVGSSVGVKKQQVEVIWGEFDEDLEDAAYRLETGGVSPVVQTFNGFYILKLVDRIPDLMLTETAFNEKRNTIAKMLRRSREAIRSGEFVAEFMKDKDVVLKGELFDLLVRALASQVDFQNASREQIKLKARPFVDGELAPVRDQLASRLGEQLVAFRGGEWTIEQFLERLWLQEVPIDRRSLEAFRGGLREAIRIMVRDMLLAEEGCRRNLDNRLSVRRDMQMWKDNFYYVAYKNMILGEKSNVAGLLDDLRKKVSVSIDEEKLRTLQLSEIPMIATWTNFQRQLVVPRWPRFSNDSK